MAGSDRAGAVKTTSERPRESAKTPAAGSSHNLPRRVGAYTLFDFIGRGGMAEIFLARAHTDLGAVRLCVVKEILPEFSQNKDFADMLTFEAKLAARLSHANIVQVFDLGRADGHLFIAMEYVEGLDLNALLRRCTMEKVSLPVEFAIGIVCEALRGLDYAHRRVDDLGKPLGIVHRDVSPSNLLISFDGEVKLCDFGIAKANELVEAGDPRGGNTTESAENIKGKAGYMSPEQARGQAIDARADVFSAGILLWELASGHRMYKPSSDVPLLEQARRAEITQPKKRDLPEEDLLHQVIMKALAVDREQRYATAADLVTALDDYMAKAKLVMSPLRLGDWMNQHFGAEITVQRRAREQALSAKSLPPMAIAPREKSPADAAKVEELYGPSSLVGAAMDVAARNAGESQKSLPGAAEKKDDQSGPLVDPEYEKKKMLIVFAVLLVVVMVVLAVLSRRP
jgi:serine/threonine-protein kinase